MEDKLYQKFMLSVQGALLGKITPSIRAVIVGWAGENLIKLKFVVDESPRQLHYDLLNETSAEIIADYPNIDVETKCEYSNALPKDFINGYKAFAFLRYET